MVELIVTADLALVSLIVAILKEARIIFTLNPAYGVGDFGYVSYGISNSQRIMVRSEDAAQARQLVKAAMAD
jgi:hypothetical protein